MTDTNTTPNQYTQNAIHELSEKAAKQARVFMAIARIREQPFFETRYISVDSTQRSVTFNIDVKRPVKEFTLRRHGNGY